jgi:hypothetical protein
MERHALERRSCEEPQTQQGRSVWGSFSFGLLAAMLLRRYARATNSRIASLHVDLPKDSVADFLQQRLLVYLVGLFG